MRTGSASSSRVARGSIGSRSRTTSSTPPRTLPWLGRGPNTITVVGRSRPDDRHAVDRLPDHARPVVHQERDDHDDGRPVRQRRSQARRLLVEGRHGGHDGADRGPRRPGRPGLQRQVRARSEKDRVRVTASTDGGKTWRPVAVIAGPTQGRTEHHRVDRWPPGVQQGPAPIRNDGQQHGRRSELPGRRRLPRPAGLEDDPPLPRRASLEGRGSRTHPRRDDRPPAGQVHDQRGRRSPRWSRSATRWPRAGESRLHRWSPAFRWNLRSSARLRPGLRYQTG